MFNIQKFADFDYGLMSRADKDKLDSISSETLLTKTDAAGYTQQILDAASSETAAIKVDTQQILNTVSSETAAIKTDTQQILDTVSSETAAIKTDTKQILNTLLTKSEAENYNKQLLKAIKKISSSGSDLNALIPRQTIVLEADSETNIAESLIDVSGANIDARDYNSAITIKGAGNGVLLGDNVNSVTFTGAQNTVWSGGSDTFIVNIQNTNHISDFDSDNCTIQTAANVNPTNFIKNSDTLLILPSQANAPVIILDDFDSGTVKINNTSYEIEQNILEGSFIENVDNNVAVTGSAQGDLIINGGSHVTASAGDGDNTVYNYGASNSISAGDGDNTVYNYGTGSTIKAALGDIEICSNNTFTHVNPSNNAVAVYQDVATNDSSLTPTAGTKIRANATNVTIASPSGCDITNYSDDTLYITNPATNIFRGKNTSVTAINSSAWPTLTNYAAHSSIDVANNSGSNSYLYLNNYADDCYIYNSGTSGFYTNATLTADRCTLKWKSSRLFCTVSGDDNYIGGASSSRVDLYPRNGKLNENCTIESGSTYFYRYDTIKSGSEILYSQLTHVISGDSFIEYKVNPNDRFYANGNVISCSTNGSKLLVRGGGYTCCIGDGAQSGKSYSMVHIGDGFYTIKAS